MFVGHVNLSWVNNQPIISQISVGNVVQNRWIESIEVWEGYAIAAWEQEIIARA